MFFPRYKTLFWTCAFGRVLLDVCLDRLICYLFKGKFMCFACQAAEKVTGARTSRLKHYRTRNLIKRAQPRRRTRSPPAIAANSVAPISRQTQRLNLRCCLADVEVTVVSGQNNHPRSRGSNE